MPHVESYNESKDPLDHLESFKTRMHLQEVVDEIMYRAFPTTLKGPARVWFDRLVPNSISNFESLICVQNTLERLDPKFTNYQFKFNVKQLMCGI